MMRRFGQPESGGGGDPYWANVVSLLHFDGPDGSTAITDEKGLVWSALGSASIQGGRLATTGVSGQGARTTSEVSGVSFGTDDFTVECRAIFNSVANTPHLVLIHNGWWYNRCNLWLSSGKLRWYLERGGIGADVVVTTWEPTLGVEHHIAVARQSGVTRLFADGVLIGSASDAVTYPATNAITLSSVQPMSSGAGDVLNGFVDELRITKGVARYTANFTPPTVPFPND